MPEQKLSELMDAIETAVKDAQSKLAVFQDFEAKAVAANKAYSDAASLVAKLQEEFNSRLPILTRQAIRQF